MTSDTYGVCGISRILDSLPAEAANAFSRLPTDTWRNIEELRFSAARPVLVYRQTEGLFLSRSGTLNGSAKNAVTVTARQIAQTFRQLCENSVYSKEEDIRQGFLPLPGGHRVGICGSATVRQGEITFIKHISALNLRIAHEAVGCAECVMPYVFGGGEVHNTLIVSPPGVGKTTMLRDIARILGNTHKVGIADERGEIAAVFQGTAQNDVGLRSVVMDNCPKAAAIGLMIRSMGIDCVITDELGSAADVRAAELAAYAGVRIIASAHGDSLADLRTHPHLRTVLPLFDYIILLQKNSTSRLKQIIDTKERQGGI